MKPPFGALPLSSFRKNKGIRPVASAIFPLTAVISRWFRNNTISGGKLVRVFISWPSLATGVKERAVTVIFRGRRVRELFEPFGSLPASLRKLSKV